MIDVNIEDSKAKEMQKAVQIGTYIIQKAACIQNIIKILSFWILLYLCAMFSQHMNAGFVSICCFLTK